MGATASSPFVPPVLLESKDHTEVHRTLQSEQSVRKERDTNDEKVDDISIVFVAEDEDKDENDLYYDDRIDTLCTDQFGCFGVPFLGSINPPLFTMKPLVTPKEKPPLSDNAKGCNNNDDEDEDPEDAIESLQQELKAVDAIYNYDDDDVYNDDDNDSKEAVERLQLELQQAEENYVPPRRNMAEDNGCDSSQHTLLSGGHKSQNPSSFIDLQQLLFSSGGGDGEDHDHSCRSCRIVEIYETRTTQLKPRPKSEREEVPLERMGIPFRKCRDPSCSCHRPTTTARDDRSRNRRRNRAIINRYHANNNDDNGEDALSIESQRLKKRNALHRLKKQSEKLLAMEKDGDDQTEMTVGSSSTASLYSGFSIRSDCQINRRKNHFSNDHQNSDRSHRRQRSLSVDCNEGGIRNAISKGETRMITSAVSTTIPLDSSVIALPPLLLTSTAKHSFPSNSVDGTNLTMQQRSPPPLTSPHPFGESSNPRHKSHQLSAMQSQSSKQIRLESFLEDNKNVSARRCRSEDFIDGISSNLGCGPMTNATENDMLSNINRSTAAPGQRDVNNVAHTKEIDDESFLGSPTCIMEEIHRNESYQRSRTTQHQPQDIRKQQNHHNKQPRQDLTTPTNPPLAITTGTKSQAGLNCDDRNEESYQSPLCDEREQSLKGYRNIIKFLLNQEKMDRRQKTSNTHMILHNSNRKKEKRRQQKLQQREFERSMQLAGLYHNMGLIHYQQGRYDTARHVLQCGVDALITHRSSSVTYAKGFYNETTDPFYDDYIDPYYVSSSSHLLPMLPTLDEAAPYLANPALLLAAELVLAQGKIFAAQGLWYETKKSSGKVLQWSVFQKQRLLGRSFSSSCRIDNLSPRATTKSNKYWKDWGPTMARAQVLFGRCYEWEQRPGVAMRYYQEALLVQKNVLGPGHFEAADTLYRIGNLHAASGMLGLAGHCYEQALCLYRRHRSLVPNGARPAFLDDRNSRYCSTACITADEATVLAGLGWIFLVQRDPTKALVLTNQALDGMVHALGPAHQNVILLKHQLACIHSTLTPANNLWSDHHLQNANVCPHYEKQTGGPH